MEALIPALVAALLAGVGDRPAWLSAKLADRLRAPAAVLCGGVAGQLLVNAIAAWGGVLVAPILTPNAKSILLGIALLFAGVSALIAGRLKDRLEGWNLPHLPRAFLGTFSLALGDRTAFLTFALAARSSQAWPAATGATLGCLMLAALAVTLGERSWRSRPLRLTGKFGGAVLILVGLAALGSGFRLI